MFILTSSNNFGKAFYVIIHLYEWDSAVPTLTYPVTCYINVVDMCKQISDDWRSI